SSRYHQVQVAPGTKSNLAVKSRRVRSVLNIISPERFLLTPDAIYSYIVFIFCSSSSSSADSSLEH
uniref:Uncharacterized protein n=1 Tax=Oryza brachyantha TaxID=4533 RepID=J3MTR6_ORYBR